MKTLKKTLCLVLAVVMAVGVLILPANADMETYEGFDDTEKINDAYEEAVATLTGMGIINGKGTGFDPQGGLNRAEAATLIVRAITSPATRELLVSGASKAFTDLDDSYAMKYVNYAAEKGIVSGKGNGLYYPNAPVTYAELGQMLLMATGYELKSPSENFKVNVTEFLLAYGLVDTVPTVEGNLDKELTREEASQMIWLAIQKGTESGGRKYKVEVPGEEPSYFDTLTEAYLYVAGYNSALTDQEKKDGAARYAGSEADTTGSIADLNYHLAYKSTTDDYGRNSDMWYNSANPKQVYSFITPEYDLEYNNTSVTLNKVLKDLGYKKDDVVDVTVVTDGEGSSYPDVKVDASAAANKAGLGSGKGVLFEVYNDADSKEVHIVVVNTYVHVLKKSEIVTKDDVIKIDGLEYEGASGFAEGQVVLYTKNASEIVTLTVAQNFTGKVTSANAALGYIKVEGSTVYVSTMAKSYKGDAVGPQNLVTKVEGYKYDATVYNFFEDFYGNVIYADIEAPAPAVVTDKIFIYRGVSKQYGVAGVDQLTGNTAGGNTAYARAYAIDLKTNSVITIEIAVAAENDGTTFHYVNPDGTLGAVLGSANDPFASTDGFGQVVESVFEFVLRDDGTYAIKTTAVSGVDVTLQKNVEEAITTDRTYYVNKDTSVKVISYKEKSETVGGNVAWSIDKINAVVNYSGYSRFPETAEVWQTTPHETVVVYEATDAGILTSITVITTKSVDAEPEYVPVNYAVFAGLGETSDKQEYMFFVNGEIEVYTAELGKIALTDDNAGDVYNIEIDGETLKDAELQTAFKSGKVELITEDYFVLESSAQAIRFAENCVIVDGEDDFALTTLTVGDTVAVFGTTDAQFVIVLENK